MNPYTFIIDATTEREQGLDGWQPFHPICPKFIK
jgi:hypothetical protein